MATTIQLKNCWQEVAGFPAAGVGWRNLVLGKNLSKNGSQGGVIADNKSQAEKARREKERNGYNIYLLKKTQ